MTARDEINARRVEHLTAQLAKEREYLSTVTDATMRARSLSEAATPGGLTGYDSAVLSGIRRKANPKATARRFNAYDRESALAVELVGAEKTVALLERRLAAAVTERDRVLLTREDLLGARGIRDAFGWHKVVKVNTKTVSVATAYSWTEKIPFGEIREVRL